MSTRKTLWRSLGELAQAPETRDARAREFAPGEDERPDGVERREFLRLFGAGAALAGVAGCERAPRTTIAPWVTQPAEAHPGFPRFYATAIETDGYATGLLGESHEGRPTKIEGNPEHPASLGATDHLAQASVLGLYDPDRGRSIEHRNEPASWGALQEVLLRAIPDRGRGAHRDPRADRLADTRGARRAASREVSRDRRALARAAGAREHVGRRTHRARASRSRRALTFAPADVILALDADFLSSGLGRSSTGATLRHGARRRRRPTR